MRKILYILVLFYLILFNLNETKSETIELMFKVTDTNITNLLKNPKADSPEFAYVKRIEEHKKVGHYKYWAWAGCIESPNNDCLPTMGGSSISQAHANEKGIESCIKSNGEGYKCIIVAEGMKGVVQKNVAKYLKETNYYAKRQDEKDQKKIETCKKYGFKEGTEKLGECVLKIMEMEMRQLELHKQIKTSKATSNQQNTLSLQQKKLIQTQQLNESIRMMQMGLNLMSPRSVAPAPLPNPNFNCRFIANNMYCN